MQDINNKAVPTDEIMQVMEDIISLAKEKEINSSIFHTAIISLAVATISTVSPDGKTIRLFTKEIEERALALRTMETSQNATKH